MPCRLLSWMQKDYNITGNLYWASAINTGWTREEGWNHIRDIWTEPTTIYGEGDGMLIYAGCENDGVINRNIPVGTIRLEAIRDGVEDYEYLVILQNKIQATLDKYGITDVTADSVMDSYYNALYNSIGDYEYNSERLLKIREHVAEDIMSDDDVIVGVFAAMTTDDTNMREVRVYAPVNSEVTIDGAAISGEENSEYAVYSKLFSMSRIPDFTDIEITVNGLSYKRTLKSISEYEYRELAYEYIAKDCEALGIPVPLAEVRQNYMKNIFDYLNIGNPETGKSEECITADRSILPMIKESIADDSNNKIPMIVMSEDGKLDNSKIDFKQQNLTIYVPNGAHVTVNGKAATKIEQNKNYNTFTFSVIFDTYGRQTVEISVSYNGVTEVTNRVIYQRADSRYLLLDLENSDTVKSINKMDNASVVQVQDDYGVAMHFENSARRQSFVFGNDILDGDITSCKGYNFIEFELTNNSDECIFVPNIRIVCPSTVNTITAVYGQVAPHDTVTITVPIPEKINNREFSGIAFEYNTVAGESPIDIVVSNFHLANMLNYYISDSDIILLD